MLKCRELSSSINMNFAGLEVNVAPEFRKNVRKAARVLSVLIGYTAGITAAILTVLVVADSELRMVIALCTVIFSALIIRCKKKNKSK